MKAPLILLLSFLLGAAHVISPDHWVPLSLQSWQRGWSAMRTRGVATQLYLLHILTGLLAALILSVWASALGDRTLLVFSLGMVALFTAIRFFRFSQLREAFLAGPQSKRGIMACWSLLGPAESLIPLVLKANQLGHGYIVPVLCYAAGTLVAGISLVQFGKRVWNQPGMVTQGWIWLNRITPFASVLLMMAAGLGAGLGLWVKA